MAIAQFIYIFCLQNPMAFNDIFWCRFVSIVIKIFSLMSQWAWHTVAPRQPINYFICTGFDPTQYKDKSFNIYGFFEILTVLIQLFVYFKIHQYKMKGPSLNPNTDEKRKKVMFHVEKNSMPSFLTNLFNIIVTAVSTFYMIFVIKLDPHKLNEFPHSFMVQFVCLCLFSTLVMSITASYYIKHEPLRKAVFNVITKKKNITINA